MDKIFLIPRPSFLANGTQRTGGISRVLSRTVIHLGRRSHGASNDLPVPPTGFWPV